MLEKAIKKKKKMQGRKKSSKIYPDGPFTVKRECTAAKGKRTSSPSEGRGRNDDLNKKKQRGRRGRTAGRRVNTRPAGKGLAKDKEKKAKLEYLLGGSSWSAGMHGTAYDIVARGGGKEKGKLKKKNKKNLFHHVRGVVNEKGALKKKGRGGVSMLLPRAVWRREGLSDEPGYKGIPEDHPPRKKKKLLGFSAI